MGTPLVAARHGHRARLEAVVTSEREQRRVEANGVALALQHGTLQVVVQDDPAEAAERAERLDVATQEAVHAGVEEEA